MRKEYYFSKTILFKPKIISFNEFDGDEKLKKYKNKIKNDEYFSNTEGYDLINIPRMYEKNNEEILEKVCIIFSKMKMKDDLIKYELGNQQKGIKQGINQGRKEGIKQGQKEGEIKLARKIAETIGIEETTKITGISKEEILNKKI